MSKKIEHEHRTFQIYYALKKGLKAVHQSCWSERNEWKHSQKYQLMHRFLLVDLKKRTMLKEMIIMKKPLNIAASHDRKNLTGFRIRARPDITFKSSNDLPVFEVPEARVTFDAVIERFFTIQRN